LGNWKCISIWPLNDLLDLLSLMLWWLLLFICLQKSSRWCLSSVNSGFFHFIIYLFMYIMNIAYERRNDNIIVAGILISTVFRVLMCFRRTSGIKKTILQTHKQTPIHTHIYNIHTTITHFFVQVLSAHYWRRSSTFFYLCRFWVNEIGSFIYNNNNKMTN
jgi:hypothetical protein